jgi:hypothetical protein
MLHVFIIPHVQTQSNWVCNYVVSLLWFMLPIDHFASRILLFLTCKKSFWSISRNFLNKKPLRIASVSQALQTIQLRSFRLARLSELYKGLWYNSDKIIVSKKTSGITSADVNYSKSLKRYLFIIIPIGCAIYPLTK